jgi:hypothetical protein
MNNFLDKFSPKLENRVEYEILKNYMQDRILITAEHAETKKLFLPEYGKTAFVGIGDKNTDKLAKLASNKIKCAYMISRILRTQVDLSRPYKDFRKARLYAGLFNVKFHKKTKILIHKDIAKANILLFYHKRIEELNPRAIMSFHGMHLRYKPDILLGFGPGRRYFDKPFEFREFFQSRLTNALESLKLENNMDIKISKKLFTGTKNYTLYKHIKEFNDEQRPKKKRLGIHVEFNLRGRIRKSTNELPGLRYQVASQVLAESLRQWLKSN